MKQKYGFSLIELLVVISIIALIAGLATVTITGSQKQARDARRKADLSNYRTALENMANKNNNFYKHYGSTAVNLDGICVDLGLGSNCPKDPNITDNYKIITFSTGAVGSYSATGYVLYAMLEDNSSSQNAYWFTCYNGITGTRMVTPPTSANCP